MSELVSKGVHVVKNFLSCFSERGKDLKTSIGPQMRKVLGTKPPNF